MYHYYNMVDLNNNQFELNNFYQLNQLDNNNDNLLNLSNNNFHHFDKDKLILKVKIYQKFQYDYLYMEEDLNNKHHKIMLKKKERDFILRDGQ